VTGAGDPAALDAIASGRATPQDQASQATVDAVGAQPGERVLEMGAAPGGKSTGLAEAMDDRGLVVACDLRPARLGLVHRAARRLGLEAIAPLAADGRRPPLRAASFDRVLLDAPCSGLGVLRRRPEARWRLEEAAVTELAALQRELLAAAATLVRPGGRLVYSVCTLTRAETTAVDEWAETTLPDLLAEPAPGPPWRPWGRGALLLPPVAGTDGMYVLVLTRA
jgi:16S rRNA (cytosine967-C5)-methyltransferase